MDAELIGRAQHGDEEAFASLAVAAGDRLHAVAHRILRDIELAEDATTPVRITLGGFSGKYLDLQIPADISACTNGYWPWEPGFYAQGPSQTLAPVDPRRQRDSRRAPDDRLCRDVGC